MRRLRRIIYHQSKIMPKLVIPPVLSKYTDSKLCLDYTFSNFQELLTHLKTDYPRFVSILFNSVGELDGFANFYLNSQPITLQKLKSITLMEDDILEIITSVSGG